MTVRQLVDSPTLRIAAYALALGIAWATLEAKVAQKADKDQVAAMASDIRDIKTILCKGSADSWCSVR